MSDGSRMLLTIDTSALKHRDEVMSALDHTVYRLGFTYTTVRESRRWVERWGEDCDLLTELGVWDETYWDTPCVYASKEDAVLFEAILRIISAGGFPKHGKRAGLSPGLRNHLRDALILEAHVRHRRHVFVTADRRAFIRHGNRELLQRLCETRIVEPSELAGVLPA